MKRCKGNGDAICKTCWDTGSILIAHWKKCDLYMVDGYEGQYCYEHAKELEEKVVKDKVMNKQKILEEIQKTEEHLTNMKKMLAECEYERWKPKRGEPYFFIESNGDVVNCLFDSTKTYEIRRCDFYNCFKTMEEAEAEAEKILVRRMLEDIARRLNKGKKIDWNNTGQDKHYIYLLINNDELAYASTIWFKNQGTVYCLDERFLDIAIREIGEGRLKNYLRNQ